MRDHFQYSLFGLNILLVRFLRDSKTATFFARPITHANNPALLGALLLYFRVQPLPIIFIWPKYAIHAILCDSETAMFFARPIAHANIPALLRALLL